MRVEAFREWLSQQGYEPRTIGSRISNCVLVDQSEGDLDAHYSEDRCAGVIARLSYSTADEREGRAPLHGIPICGNIRNGSATLKSAVSLYVRFSDEEQDRRFTLPDNGARDSYAEFLERFGIDKTDFYTYGIENTIFPSLAQAQGQWTEVKRRLLQNGEIAIRGYGRQGANTKLYIELYDFVFGNSNIFEDKSGNNAPRRNLQSVTTYRINHNLLNFQCSHVFGHTKNPLLFEAVWNICFSPKMFDPLTGHEAKGIWPEEYQKLLRQVVASRFRDVISDYNAFIGIHSVREKIIDFADSAAGRYNKELLSRFRDDALAQWQAIPVDRM